MTETTITLRKLTASAGHILTDGDVYGKEVYLGINDSAGNWYEITEDAYNDIVEKMNQETEE